MRGAKIDKISSGEDTWPFSGPGERSRGIETGNLQEIAVRTWGGPFPGVQNRLNRINNYKNVGLLGFL